MRKFIEYDNSTGLIHRVITFWSEELGKEIYPNCLMLAEHEEVNDVRHFIKNGEVTLRPEMKLRFDKQRVYGMPVPAVIVIEGQRYKVDGPDMYLEFSLPGRYQVSIVSWPYNDYVFEVNNDQD